MTKAHTKTTKTEKNKNKFTKQKLKNDKSTY